MKDSRVWEGKFQWAIVALILLAGAGSFFGGEAQANVNPEPEKYIMDRDKLPPVQPFEMRWPDVNYFLSCVVMNPQGIYACKFVPNGQ